MSHKYLVGGFGANSKPVFALVNANSAREAVEMLVVQRRENVTLAYATELPNNDGRLGVVSDLTKRDQWQSFVGTVEYEEPARPNYLEVA